MYLVRIGTNTYAMKMLLKDHVLACKMGAQVNAERDIGMECDSPFMVNLYGTFRSVQFPLRACPVPKWCRACFACTHPRWTETLEASHLHLPWIISGSDHEFIMVDVLRVSCGRAEALFGNTCVMQRFAVSVHVDGACDWRRALFLCGEPLYRKPGHR